MLGDGWPINLGQGVQSMPIEQIQLTLSAMFAGVMQAASLKSKTRNISGVIPLDVPSDRLVLRLFKRLEKAQLALPAKDTPFVEVERLLGIASRVDYRTYEGKGLVLHSKTGRPLLDLTEKTENFQLKVSLLRFAPASPLLRLG